MQIEFIKAISNSSSYFIKYDNKTSIINEVSFTSYGNEIIYQFKSYWMSNKNWWFYKRNTFEISEFDYNERLKNALSEVSSKYG